MTAGALLAVRREASQHGLVMPSVDQIIDAMGASRSRAYEIKNAVDAFLPALERPPGRPRAEVAPASSPKLTELLALATETLCFVMRHPGCVQSGERARYSDSYRRFMIELRERHADVTLPELAEVLALPLGTLEDWMRCARPAVEPDATPNADPPRAAERDARQAGADRNRARRVARVARRFRCVLRARASGPSTRARQDADREHPVRAWRAQTRATQR